MITSPANPTVKELVRLRQRRHRDRTGRFLVEGARPLALAARAGVELVEQVVCPALGGSPLPGIPVVEMAEAPFRKVSVRQNPDGMLGVAHHLDLGLASLRLGHDPLMLMVESIEKPGNLGAMLRTADALGVEAVVVADPATDVHNPNVVRASQGALFTVPLAVAPLPRVLEWLERRHVRLLATTPEPARSPWEVELTGAVALAVGAEATGLTSVTRRAATETMSVPMRGTVDSLNASVAAAILLYEAVRQRRQG